MVKMLGYDNRDLESLRDDVYAPRVLMDYSALLGTEPTETSRDEWIKNLSDAVAGFDSTQHTATYACTNAPTNKPLFLWT